MGEMPGLEYRSPSNERFCSRGAALLLCAPGALAFTVFFGGDHLPSGIGEFLGGLFWPLWMVAVATAIASVCLYMRFGFKPLPWFVILNLAINISGLLLSLSMLAVL